MGNIRPIKSAQAMGIATAVSAYLATLSGTEQRGTKTVYGSTLWALAADLTADPATGAAVPFAVAELDTEASVDRLTDWFTTRRPPRAPAGRGRCTSSGTAP